MDARRMVKLVLVVAIMGSALAFPATAGAYGGWYCGSLKGSGNWCGWPSGAHTWEYNSAYYLGSGSIPVCQRLWDQINQNPYGNTCGQNFTERMYYPNRTWGAHVAQFSGYNHTVWGFATTNRCDVVSCGTPASNQRRARSRAAVRASALQGLPAPLAEPVADMVFAPPAETAANFGVFKQDSVASDVPLVGSDPVPLRGRSSQLFGANFRLARRAELGSRNGVFLVPGRRELCVSLVVGIEGITTCGGLDDAVAGRLVGTASDDGGQTIVYGAVPDGVDDVTVLMDDRRSVPAEVGDNAYVAAVDGVPTTISYATVARRVRADVPYPSNE